MIKILSADDKELVFQLAERLIGTCQTGKYRREVLTANVQRRVTASRCRSLAEYLHLANSDKQEFAQLISALTIHTTGWFREMPHFTRLEQHLSKQATYLSKKKVRILSAACSTGEEAYSFALVLEAARNSIPNFDYEVIGIDIDPVSVKKARRGIFPLTQLPQIPEKYRKFLLKGTGKTAEFFTLSKEIKDRCKFATSDLKTLKSNGTSLYNSIVCRNVLIYFSPDDVDKIVRAFLSMLAEDGILCLGHSEAIDSRAYGLKSLGNAVYTRQSAVAAHVSQSKKSGPRNVLVVDDSLTIRKTMKSLIEQAGHRPVLAASAKEATAALNGESFDLITLDLNMPEVSGQEWLAMQRSLGLRVPTIILSGVSADEAVTVLGALESGAQDYIDKSVLHSSKDEVIERIGAFLSASTPSTHSRKPSLSKQDAIELQIPDLILIGASTGGTQVLSEMLKSLPKNCPPLIIAQHITPAFAKPFAERLAKTSGLILSNLEEGVLLEPGHLYMAQGDNHIAVRQSSAGTLHLSVSSAPPVNRHRPSVDYLFQSAVGVKNKNILAVLLTGMGADGAKGLAALRKSGAATLVQDEQSCVVFGMPKEAIRLGAAQFIGTPEDIRRQIDSSISAIARRR